jgi:DNA polymerase V
MSEEWAHSNMGGVVGVRLIRELRGFPSILMEEELLSKKMIATTRMFGRAVTELSELREAVATYISRAAEKLRRQNSAAKIVSVFLVPREQDYSGDFKQEPSINSHTVLPAATSFTHELIKPAIDLVENLFEKGREYKKAGVMLGGLVPDKSVQGNLFISETGNGNRFLMSAIDNVNFGMREDAVKFASSGLQKNWKMRQELRSGRYSTRWEDIREVK